MVEAIQDYRKDSDRIGQFIEAWLEVGETYEVRTSAAYYRYGKWCEKYGYNSENMKNFNNAMSRYFEVKRKRPKEGGAVTTMIVGCRFLEAENGEEDADPEVLEDAKMEFKPV